jgi:hypothetical protein
LQGREFACDLCRPSRAAISSAVPLSNFRPEPFAPLALEVEMRDVSRHKSMDVPQAYVRDADLFKDHAGIGLL